MARTESKRELILANLKTTLAAINGVDPYWTTVKSVKRVPTVPTQFEATEKPGLLIVATGEPETIENLPGFRDRRTMAVGIIGVLDLLSTDEGTQVDRFIKDVNIAVKADVTRGGYASMTFTKSQNDATGLFRDLGIFEIELAIVYHCNAQEE